MALSKHVVGCNSFGCTQTIACYTQAANSYVEKLLEQSYNWAYELRVIERKENMSCVYQKSEKLVTSLRVQSLLKGSWCAVAGSLSSSASLQAVLQGIRTILMPLQNIGQELPLHLPGDTGT